MEKLTLKEKIQAVDLRARDLWDELDEYNQKILKGEFFILNRYISNVKTSNRSVKEHYIMSVNEYYNKNFYNIQKHPKLLWLLLSMCGYNGETTYFHEWIGVKKGVKNKKQALLAELMPNHKHDEIEMLDNMMSLAEVKELAMAHGYSDKDIKDKL